MESALLDILADALKDTLYLLPFLFLTYIAMEVIEHKAKKKTQKAIRRAGAAGPVIGAVLGVVPQCGFSAAAGTLWAGRVITLGTLFAVFLSTSDEMLPVFIAEGLGAPTIIKVLCFKVFVAMLAGFIVDAIMRLARRDKHALKIHELCKRDKCQCNGACETCKDDPKLAYNFSEDQKHEHNHESGSVIKSAAKHTLQVTLFIFLVTLLLNACLTFIGEEALRSLFAQNELLAILASSTVGLIPNCAASVVIAQLFVDGAINAGAMISGLLVSCGVGLLVLVRTNRSGLQNACIIAALWACGVIGGLVVNALGMQF